jgi:hypothetical protein
MTRQRLAALATTALLLTGCTAGSASTPAGAPPSPPAPAATTASPATTTSPATTAAPASTTNTSWGPILDQAPASFPRYPGAADANGAASGPATQSLSTSATVTAVSGWYGSALSPAGYKQTSISNPAEDGSVIAEFDGTSLATGCKAQLTYKPTGSQTLIVVLVAPACPAS